LLLKGLLGEALRALRAFKEEARLNDDVAALVTTHFGALVCKSRCELVTKFLLLT
jgi:hypothetical protein